MSAAAAPAAEPRRPILEVRGLVKEFPGVKALQGVDLDVLPGEVHCLLGPNGAGKSTLIKCVSGAVEPTAGEILFEGEPLPVGRPAESLARGVATIYQELDLVDDLTVAQSIFLAHEPRRRGLLDLDRMAREASALLERLGHTGIPPRAKVGALRPAAKQIVSIARALSHDVRLLIMDEPSAILDEEEIDTLFGVVRRLTGAGVGVIYISHRLEEIRRIGDRVTVLAEGRTTATGIPADTPTDELVAKMIGRRVEQLYPERPTSSGRVVLEVRGLRALPMVSEASLEVHAGEVVGLGGLVGAGRSELLGLIRIAFGGQVAEELFFGEAGTGPSGDLQAATQAACQMVGSLGMAGSLISYDAMAVAGAQNVVAKVLSTDAGREAVDRILNDAKAAVQRMLDENRHVVEALRDALLERDELLGDEIVAVVDAARHPERIDVSDVRGGAATL